MDLFILMVQNDLFSLANNVYSPISEEIIKELYAIKDLNEQKIKAIIQIQRYSLKSMIYNLSRNDYLIITENEVLICSTDDTDGKLSINFKRNVSQIKKIIPKIFSETGSVWNEREKLLFYDTAGAKILETELFINQSEPIVEFFKGDSTLSSLLGEPEIIPPDTSSMQDTPEKTLNEPINYDDLSIKDATKQVFLDIVIGVIITAILGTIGILLAIFVSGSNNIIIYIIGGGIALVILWIAVFNFAFPTIGRIFYLPTRVGKVAVHKLSKKPADEDSDSVQ